MSYHSIGCRATLVILGLMVAGCTTGSVSHSVDDGTKPTETTTTAAKPADQSEAEPTEQAATSDETAAGESAEWELTEAQWKERLTPIQYYVTRQKGTEERRTGEYWDCKKKGVYHCVCCGLPLFDSETKFVSGTGWPSFWQPIDQANVAELDDSSLFMTRTEIVCSRCDAHLGHVFDDGPAPTGLRYCMNSAALKLVEQTAGDSDQKDGATVQPKP